LVGDSVLSEELLELVDRKSNGRQPGFTKACRMILMESGRALSARDVCDQIQVKIPAMLARHKDPMASVTTVLNRLVDYGEAQPVVLSNGRRAWQWIADSGSSTQNASSETRPAVSRKGPSKHGPLQPCQSSSLAGPRQHSLFQLSVP